MFIALEKSVIFLYSRYEEEGYVVLPLCVCLFVPNIYVAFFSATIRRKCYTYKTLFVKACTIVGVTFLLTLNDSKIEIL